MAVARSDDGSGNAAGNLTRRRLMRKPVEVGAGVSAREARDVGARDAGGRDAGGRDAGSRDSGGRDSGGRDSATRDGGGSPPAAPTATAAPSAAPSPPGTRLEDLYRLPMPKLFAYAEREGMGEHTGMNRGQLIMGIVRRQIERGMTVRGSG